MRRLEIIVVVPDDVIRDAHQIADAMVENYNATQRGNEPLWLWSTEWAEW